MLQNSVFYFACNKSPLASACHVGTPSGLVSTRQTICVWQHSNAFA